MIYLDIDGSWLDRFRRWIERLPDKNFQQSNAAEKIGRTLTIAGVLAVFVQSTIHLISTSAATVSARFTAFAVKMAIGAYRAVCLI